MTEPMEPMEMTVWYEHRVRGARLTRLVLTGAGLSLVVVLFGVLRWAGSGA